MNFGESTRTYLVRLLSERGLPCPALYVSMLEKTEPNRTIDGLRPWAFDHDPQSAIGFCSEAVGREVWPFAQAIGQDLMACFEANQSPSLPIVVINPWASNGSSVVQKTFPDVEAWLVYAKEISEAVLAREREEDN